MLRCETVRQPADYFKELSARPVQCVYFSRIAQDSETVRQFLVQYFDAARRSGVVIDGRLQNPANHQLDFYQETMGMDFALDHLFIGQQLQKWLPRMSSAQRENVGGAIYNTLVGLKRSGKNENMLKNAYVKFMCWLYYRFERIVHQLGAQKLPKILIVGEVGTYELLILYVLASAGCDIVLVEPKGDSGYARVDPQNHYSGLYAVEGGRAFPADFSLKTIQQEAQTQEEMAKLYSTPPDRLPCTNVWLSGNALADLRKPPAQRGSDPLFFYNAFMRIEGVEDKATYESDLFRLSQDIRRTERSLIILNELPPPIPTETSTIVRRNYNSITELILHQCTNFVRISQLEIQRLVKKAYVDLMLEEFKRGESLPRLLNRSVTLIALFLRYYERLFSGWKYPEIAAFFYMGGARNEHEAFFLRFLARLPVDVVVFKPDEGTVCALADDALYVVHNAQSMALSRYPETNAGLHIGTVAYHAERELDTLLYQDSGLYRSQQYARAEVITLRTMYEEIPLYWNEEMPMRQGFSTQEDTVNLPVFFAKVCGVKDGNIPAYWSSIKPLLTPETTLIQRVPVIPPGAPNPMKQYAPSFFQAGRLKKRVIKSHKDFPYKILREPMQDYMLEKLDMLIQQKLIKGTFENGTEYTIIATALNLDMQTLRQIQRFDFTKKNPKLIYIITGEQQLSLEDTIYLSYMNLIGFDILLFVPTGYQCFEQHLNTYIFEEHQIGEFLYDLEVPNFAVIPEPQPQKAAKPSWRRRLFGRGG